MKKRILYLVLLSFFTFSSFAQDQILTRHELDSILADRWNKPEYLKANTALDECYLTQDEKDVFRYLNMARINPSLFAETYVNYFNGIPGYTNAHAFEERKKSLMTELAQMQPLAPLAPQQLAYESAKCFAETSGALGKIGNDRTDTTCESKFAECCAYNSTDGLFVVLGFLIDAGKQNDNLGHRKICLGNYGGLGVSIRPHTTKKFITVLNFGFNPNVIYKRDGYEGYLTAWGDRQSKGTNVYPNGDKYEGDWHNNLMNGYGVYHYSNGNRYEGQWIDAKRKGLGTLTFANGDKYIGEWDNSQMHGQGTYFFVNGKKVEGIWDKGGKPK